MKPQLNVKMTEPIAPTPQIIMQIFFLESFWPILESSTAETTASTKENAESIPRQKMVVVNIKHQKFPHYRVLIAAGYDINARPMELVSLETGEFISVR